MNEPTPDDPNATPLPLPSWRLVLALSLPVLAQQGLSFIVLLSDRYLAGHLDVSDQAAVLAAQTTVALSLLVHLLLQRPRHGRQHRPGRALLARRRTTACGGSDASSAGAGCCPRFDGDRVGISGRHPLDRRGAPFAGPRRRLCGRLRPGAVRAAGFSNGRGGGHRVSDWRRGHATRLVRHDRHRASSICRSPGVSAAVGRRSPTSASSASRSARP